MTTTPNIQPLVWPTILKVRMAHTLPTAYVATYHYVTPRLLAQQLLFMARVGTDFALVTIEEV